METATLLLLLLLGAIAVMLVLSLTLLVWVVIRAARSGRVCAEGGLEVGGARLHGKIDANHEK